MLQRIVNEKFGAMERKPKPPKIEKREALEAQKELNKLLRRKDIAINALPTNEGKILILLLHGYLASKWLWIDPYFGTFSWLRNYKKDPLPINYGWHPFAPPSFMYTNYEITISPLVFPEGLFPYLMRKGFEVITYSQIDPCGDIDTSVKELDIILKGIKKIYGERKYILVGHSRGGICIRRYLDLNLNPQVKKVITLSSPHNGTTLTNLKLIKQPIMKILNQSVLKKLWDISGKREVKDLAYEQMMPNSSFLTNLLDREKNPHIDYVTIGGTCPTFFNIYSWSITKKDREFISPNRMFTINKKGKKEEEKEKQGGEESSKEEEEKKKERQKQVQWIAYPKKILSVFEKTLKAEFIYGDGMVTVPSAILKDVKQKYILDLNHEEIAVSDEVKKVILKEAKLTRSVEKDK